MKLSSAPALLCISLWVHSSTAAPMSRRVLSALQILQLGVTDGCSATRITIVQAALTQAAELATQAVDVLSQTNAVKSEGVITWLGDIDDATLLVMYLGEGWWKMQTSGGKRGSVGRYVSLLVP